MQLATHSRHIPRFRPGADPAWPPPGDAGSPPTPPSEGGFWRDLRHDLRDSLLHWDQERLEDLGRLFKTLGGPLKSGWNVVRDLPQKVLNHPFLAERVEAEERDGWSALGRRVGTVAGLSAAGAHLVSGGLKVGSGLRQGEWGRGLDGLVDLASGATLALAVAGLTGARALVAPLAAALNVVRGGHSVTEGFQRGDSRRQIQGSLEVVRSAGSIGRLLRTISPALGVMGVALAPLAGLLHAGRGLHDLKTGLRNEDAKKQVQGLADLAASVGTALAFASGAAILPGLALAMAAQGVKLGYQVSPRMRRRVDAALTKHEPRLQRWVDRAEGAARPAVRVFRELMRRWRPTVDPQGPARFDPPLLAEVLHLLHADGRLSRSERDRLRTDLEQVGQSVLLPPRKAPLPERDLDGLRALLVSQPERRDFLDFLRVVADYNAETHPREAAYLRELETELLSAS